LKDIASIKPSELQAKTDFPFKIKHPYSYEEIEIEVTLELCTVHKNVPYGLAIINYKDPDYSDESFKGVAIFNNGKLEMTQFLCINDDGLRFQIMNMKDGRPQ
jgi:antitoxin component YwqK of YwqJK toxin-antitoxin module